MTTRIAVGLDDHHEGYACGLEAARAALTDFRGETPNLALLFTSHPEPEQVLRGVNKALGDTPLIGATSAGQYTRQGYVEQGTGIMLIRSDNIQFHPLVHERSWFKKKLLGKLQGTSEGGLGSPYHHRALMLFPDDRSMNLDKVVNMALTETAMLYDILGGPGPTLPAPPRPPALFYKERMYRSGLTATELLSQEPLGLALANGWTPVSGPYRVTHVDERHLFKIDGRPAREIYEDFFAEQNLKSGLSPELLFQYPIGICTQGDCKVSMVMGFTSDGALQMACPPARGSLIHILSTRPDAMITAAQRAIQQARSQLQGQAAAGVLFIDCMSTAMILDSAYERQRQVVQETLSSVPFLGFRSHGVLARLEGQTAGHYECSVATCVLPG